MSQSITIKTVEAQPFKDLSATLTPRFKLVVEYTLGGTSFLTGATFPRGYAIAVQHDRVSDRGFTSLILDGKGNPTACIEGAKRFSAKTLERIANDVRSGKHDELIAKLYAKAKDNRPEYAWPDMLPLVAPVVLPTEAIMTDADMYQGAGHYDHHQS